MSSERIQGDELEDLCVKSVTDDSVGFISKEGDWWARSRPQPRTCGGDELSECSETTERSTGQTSGLDGNVSTLHSTAQHSSQSKNIQTKTSILNNFDQYKYKHIKKAYKYSYSQDYLNECSYNQPSLLDSDISKCQKLSKNTDDDAPIDLKIVGGTREIGNSATGTNVAETKSDSTDSSSETEYKSAEDENYSSPLNLVKEQDCGDSVAYSCKETSECATVSHSWEKTLLQEGRAASSPPPVELSQNNNNKNNVNEEYGKSSAGVSTLTDKQTVKEPHYNTMKDEKNSDSDDVEKAVTCDLMLKSPVIHQSYCDDSFDDGLKSAKEPTVTDDLGGEMEDKHYKDNRGAEAENEGESQDNNGEPTTCCHHPTDKDNDDDDNSLLSEYQISKIQDMKIENNQIIDLKEQIENNEKDEMIEAAENFSDEANELKEVLGGEQQAKVGGEAGDTSHVMSSEDHVVEVKVEEDIISEINELNQVECDVVEMKEDIVDEASELKQVKCDVEEMKEDVTDEASELKQVECDVEEMKKDVTDEASDLKQVECDVEGEMKDDIADEASDMKQVEYDVEGGMKEDITDEASELKAQTEGVKLEEDVINETSDLKDQQEERTIEEDPEDHEVNELKEDQSEIGTVEGEFINELKGQNDVTAVKEDPFNEVSELKEGQNEGGSIEGEFIDELKDQNDETTIKEDLINEVSELKEDQSESGTIEVGFNNELKDGNETGIGEDQLVNEVSELKEDQSEGGGGGQAQQEEDQTGKIRMEENVINGMSSLKEVQSEEGEAEERRDNKVIDLEDKQLDEGDAAAVVEDVSDEVSRHERDRETKSKQDRVDVSESQHHVTDEKYTGQNDETEQMSKVKCQSNDTRIEEESSVAECHVDNNGKDEDETVLGRGCLEVESKTEQSPPTTEPGENENKATPSDQMQQKHSFNYYNEKDGIEDWNNLNHDDDDDDELLSCQELENNRTTEREGHGNDDSMEICQSDVKDVIEIAKDQSSSNRVNVKRDATGKGVKRSNQEKANKATKKAKINYISSQSSSNEGNKKSDSSASSSTDNQSSSGASSSYDSSSSSRSNSSDSDSSTDEDARLNIRRAHSNDQRLTTVNRRRREDVERERLRRRIQRTKYWKRKKDGMQSGGGGTDVKMKGSSVLQCDANADTAQRSTRTPDRADNAVNYGSNDDVIYIDNDDTVQESSAVSLKMENDDDKRPLKCELCRYSCKIPGTMRKHMSKDHPEKGRGNILYACTNCSYVNTFKEDIKKHNENKHGGKGNYTCVVSRPDSYNLEYDFFQVEIPYPCRFCNYVTTMGYDMTDHMWYRHRDLIEALSDFRREKRHTSKSGPSDRFSVSSSYYMCQCCDYKTRYPDRFDAHVSTLHAKRTYRCKYCAYTTLRKCEMNKHKAAIHETDSLHVCNLCSFRTTRKSHLSRHILLKHSQEYLFSCRYCNYKTTSTNSFSHHVQMEHT